MTHWADTYGTAAPDKQWNRKIFEKIRDEIFTNLINASKI